MPINGRRVQVLEGLDGKTHLTIPGTGSQRRRCFCNPTIYVNQKKIKEYELSCCPVLTCHECENQREGLERFWKRVDAMKEASK